MTMQIKPMAEIDLTNIEAAARIDLFAHPADTLKLVAEIRRYRRGELTPEELQNVCHNLSAGDKEAFMQGCTEYQRILCGTDAVSEEHAAIEKFFAEEIERMYRADGISGQEMNGARMLSERLCNFLGSRREGQA